MNKILYINIFIFKKRKNSEFKKVKYLTATCIMGVLKKKIISRDIKYNSVILIAL